MGGRRERENLMEIEIDVSIVLRECVCGKEM